MRLADAKPAIGLAALLLTSCAARRDLVVVLPEADGHVGAVVVHTGSASAVLNHAYAAAAPGRTAPHPLGPAAMDGARVKRQFGDALAALPASPVSQTLFFENDSLTLTPESAAALRSFLDAIRNRPAVEIVVTGHTDTVGADDHNDALSLQRAESIRQVLIPILKEYGVAADAVTTAGRGKRDLLVQTPDQTAEPRNRRVEITVR